MAPRRLIGLVLLVAGAAAAEQPPGRPFPANRTCSAIDPAYVSLAEETGGLLLPLSPQTLATHAKEIGALLAARLASVDLVRGELAGGHRRIEAPVEAGVTRLVVSVCVDEERESALLDPQDAAFREDDPSGEPKSVRLALVDADGARIADAPLAGRDGRFVAHLATPAKPFRLQVSGADRFDQRFRRTLPRLVRPVSGDAPSTPADRGRGSGRRSRTP